MVLYNLTKCLKVKQEAGTLGL